MREPTKVARSDKNRSLGYMEQEFLEISSRAREGAMYCLPCRNEMLTEGGCQQTANRPKGMKNTILCVLHCIALQCGSFDSLP